MTARQVPVWEIFAEYNPDEERGPGGEWGDGGNAAIEHTPGSGVTSSEDGDIWSPDPNAPTLDLSTGLTSQSLTSEQTDAVNQYIIDDSRQIGAYMRTGEYSLGINIMNEEPNTKANESTFSEEKVKSVAANLGIATRASTMNEAGTLYRAAGYVPEYKNLAPAFNTEDDLEGITSSIEEGTFFVIAAPAGTMGTIGDEALGEFILPNDTTFQVDNVDDLNESNIVHVHIVSQTTS
jgi:hypothetical protein